LEAALAPDAIITPDHSGSKSPYSTRQINPTRPFLEAKPHILNKRQISIEFKRKDVYDCGFQEGQVTEGTIQNYLKHDQQGKLFLQSLRYSILGQFAMHPHRYVFHITVTGELLRIWKFCPTGCQVTTAIEYTKDARPFVKFLMAIKRCSYSGIGLDMGEGAMFQDAPNESLEKVTSRMSNIRRLYNQEAYRENPKRHDWLTNDEEFTCWVFDPSVRSTREFQPATVDGQKVGKFSERVVVFSTPLYRSLSLTSRGTRCYLGVEESFLLGEEFENATSLEKLRKMHTLKTAWHHIERTSEAEFHQKIVERRKEDNLIEETRLATALAGGTVIGSTNRKGATMPVTLQLVTNNRSIGAVHDRLPESVTSPEEHDSDIPDKVTRVGVSIIMHGEKLKADTGSVTREKQREVSEEKQPSDVDEDDPMGETKVLNWVLFKEVGGRLEEFYNVHELVNVILDSTKGATLSNSS
jgi:hypothetical protein